MYTLDEYLGFCCSRYDEASIEYKPYRQKDGALLAIGALCDKLKQTEPYKSELERMLVQHVFPEFNSPVGHLRAKVYKKKQENPKWCFYNFQNRKKWKNLYAW